MCFILPLVLIKHLLNAEQEMKEDQLAEQKAMEQAHKEAEELLKKEQERLEEEERKLKEEQERLEREEAEKEARFKKLQEVGGIISVMRRALLSFNLRSADCQQKKEEIIIN